MKVIATKPVFYGGLLYNAGDVFDLKDGHKLNEKVMRALEEVEAAEEVGAEKKSRKKKSGDDQDTFSEMSKEDTRTAAEKAAEEIGAA